MKKKAPVSNTGGSGFDFEDEVGARFLIDLIGSTNTLGLEHFGKVIKLDWQVRESGWLIDDMLVTSQLAGAKRCSAISVKSGQSVSVRGFPTDFVEAVWAQKLQNGTDRCLLESDVLVLVTGEGEQSAEKPWETLLSQALVTTPDRMLNRLVDDKAIGQQSSKEQRAIFKSFSPPKVYLDKNLSDENTVEMVTQCRWIDFDYDRPQSQDYEVALSACKGILAVTQAHLADTLWQRLIGIAGEKRKLGGTLTLPALLKELGGQFDFKDNPDFAGDWAELDKRTAVEMADIRTEISGLPKLIRKNDADSIEQQLDARSICFLVGDSGCGKSAIVKDFAVANYKRIIWLGNDSLEYGTLPDYEMGIGLRHSLIQIIDGTIESTVLVFDAMEGYSSKARKVAAQIITAVRSSPSAIRTHILVSAQSESTPTLIANLMSLGLDADVVLKTTAVSRPSESDVGAIVASIPKLGWVALNPEIRKILTNLKMLDWFVQFSKSGGTIGTENVGLTTLIDSLWSHWVESGREKYAKSRLLMHIATIQADKHINSVARSELGHDEQGTLGTLIPGELLKIHNNRIQFSHDLMSDWARLQALIDGDWLADAATREKYASPRWYRAIRLYGQRLLEQSGDGCETWRKQLETVDDGTPTGTLIRDLFIEALYLAPNSTNLLEQAWPVLIAKSGALLGVLLKSFLFVATLPDPRLVLMLDSPDDLSKFEHLMRVPFWPYWGPVISVLHAHKGDSAKYAPTLSSKVCAMWLRTMVSDDYQIIWRKEAAELSLAVAREIQFLNEQGPHYSEGADKSIYEALFLSASEFPDAVGQLCLELAKRRDEIPEAAERISNAKQARFAELKKQQAASPPKKTLPSPISFRGPLRKPWPDGPRSRVDNDFIETSLDGQALSALAKVRPFIALEVLLATCIEEPQHEEHGTSYREELGVNHWQGGEPPMWYKGPFLQFLKVAPDQALTFVIKLVNFAAARASGGISLTFKIDGKHKKWFGDSTAFAWHYDGYTLHASIVHCSLMALEKWLYEQIEAGADINAVLKRLMEESEAIAFAGLLLTVGKKKPDLLMGPLAPLLHEWMLWSWDFQLTDHRNAGMAGSFGYWGNQHATAIKVGQEWIQQEHRKLSIRDLVILKFLPDDKYSKQFENLIKAWENQLDEQRKPVELRQLVEVIRRSNYKFGVVDGEVAPVEFNLPEPDRVEYGAKAQKAGQSLQFLQTPMRCRRVLTAKTPLPEDQLQPLFDYLQTLPGKIEDVDEDGDETVHPVEDSLIGGIAVLLSLHMQWLSSSPQRLDWCRRQLAISLSKTPRRSRYYSETANGDETWDGFAADCGVSMLANDTSDVLARRLVARGITSYFYSSTQLIITRASELKERLGDDFGRIVSTAIEWSALRPVSRYIQPELAEKTAHYETRKTSLIDAFVNASISPVIPNLTDLNAATRVELDQLDDLRNPEWAKRRGPKGKHKGFKGSREELGVQHLALDTRIIRAAFSWLHMSWANTPAERLHVLSLLSQLRDIVLKAIPVIEDRETQELKGLPSDFDSWVFERLCEAIPLLSPEESPERFWQPVLALGPHPHEWVERFYWDWFTKGSKSSGNLGPFFKQWRSMIEYALNSEDWDQKKLWHHQIDSMVFELLGFDARWSVWRTLPGVETYVDEMFDLFQRASAKWFALPKVLAGFVTFASSVPGSQLALISIPWIADAVHDFDSYDWRYGTEEAMIDYVDISWKRHSKEITTDPTTRVAFFNILKAVVARGSHAAIALRDRISNDAQG